MECKSHSLITLLAHSRSVIFHTPLFFKRPALRIIKNAVSKLFIVFIFFSRFLYNVCLKELVCTVKSVCEYFFLIDIMEYMIDRAKPDWKPPPEAVVTLTSDNFAEIVDDQELLLVEFYAPWCGHCKKLAPEFEKAAKQLAQMEKKIMLAKVDATVETDLAER